MRRNIQGLNSRIQQLEAIVDAARPLSPLRQIRQFLKEHGSPVPRIDWASLDGSVHRLESRFLEGDVKLEHMVTVEKVGSYSDAALKQRKGRDEFNCFNPSIVWYQKNYHLFQRCHNASSFVYYSVLDESMRDPGGHILAIRNSYRPLGGPEDPRGFVYQDRLFVQVNIDEHHGRAMHFYEVATKRLFPAAAQGFKLGDTEKNWSMFVYDGGLYAVYWLDPLVLLRCQIDDENTLFVCGIAENQLEGKDLGVSSTQALRGGTTLEPISPHCYFALAHSWGPDYQTHMFVLCAQPKWHIVWVSHQLLFDREMLQQELDSLRLIKAINHRYLIQYPTGLVGMQDGRWLVSFNLDDQRSLLVRLPDVIEVIAPVLEREQQEQTHSKAVKPWPIGATQTLVKGWIEENHQPGKEGKDSVVSRCKACGQV